MEKQVRHINKSLENCSVAIRGSSFYLTATLPSKSDPHKRSSARISLGLKAEAFNQTKIKELAHRLEDQLAEGVFSWDDWSSEVLDRLNAGLTEECITRDEYLEAINEAFAVLNPDVEKSWKTVWGKKWSATYNRIKELGPGAVTEQDLKNLLRANEKPASRKNDGGTLSAVIKFKGWEDRYDPTQIAKAASGYNKEALKPRDIPDDSQLLSYVDQIHDKRWQWMYKMILAYGIRPHEITNCSFIDEIKLEVISNKVRKGKPEKRIAWCCPEEWFKELNLEVIYRPTQAVDTVAKAAADYLSHEKAAGRPGIRTRPARIPFSLYTLRHAYAIRLMNFGFTDDIGAKLMGHTVEVHNDTYRYWTNERHMDVLLDREGHKLKRDREVS